MLFDDFVRHICHTSSPRSTRRSTTGSVYEPSGRVSRLYIAPLTLSPLSEGFRLLLYLMHERRSELGFRPYY